MTAPFVPWAPRAAAYTPVDRWPMQHQPCRYSEEERIQQQDPAHDQSPFHQ